jgi:hypothetical protein
MNSLSSLACSGQLIARLEAEYILHLLKTANRKLSSWRTKSKYYFCLLFAMSSLAYPAFFAASPGAHGRNPAPMPVACHRGETHRTLSRSALEYPRGPFRHAALFSDCRPDTALALLVLSSGHHFPTG